MEYLFPDIDISNLTRFIIPNEKEIIHWLKQTKGVYTDDIRNYFNIRLLPNREIVVYQGSLSLMQQIYIIQSINED